MNIIQKLNELAQQSMPECLKKTYIHGTWQIVRCCPNLITGEWFNIGVGFKFDGQQHFKFLNDFKKTEILLGKDEARFLREIIEMTESFFNDGCLGFSSQIRLIEVGFHKAESVEKALQDSYDRVVTLRGVV